MKLFVLVMSGSCRPTINGRVFDNVDRTELLAAYDNRDDAERDLLQGKTKSKFHDWIVTATDIHTLELTSNESR